MTNFSGPYTSYSIFIDLRVKFLIKPIWYEIGVSSLIRNKF